MHNIPIFTAESGVASLILEEIPYKRVAYIKIQATQTPQLLLSECVAFCKAAGAEHIFASGHSYLKEYPLHTVIYEMSIRRKELPAVDADARLVEQKGLNQWVELFNKRMSDVPNAASMTITSAKKFLDKGSLFFVYDRTERIGLGCISGNKLQAFATLVPGQGKTVLCALSKQFTAERVVVEVASTNAKAMRLYKDVGFVIDKLISEWYVVL